MRCNDLQKPELPALERFQNLYKCMNGEDVLLLKFQFLLEADPFLTILYSPICLNQKNHSWIL